MPTPAAEFRWGTSSWSESSWVGSFYPQGTPPSDFLVEYAKVFDTAEVDATYYGVPRPSTVDLWASRTPDGFVMSAKFPRSIVHGGDGPRPDPAVVLVPERVREETAAFLASMGRLGDKRGPLVLQFPWFGPGVFPDRRVFLDRLDGYLASLPPDFRYAVEVRNGEWLDRTLAELLHARGAALVLVDMARMPHPADVARRLNVVTTDFAYCRLIGDRQAIEALTDTFDREILDRTEALAAWVPLLHFLRRRVTRVLVYANNHYAGHGPATIRRLREMLEQAAGPGADP